jgi:hypothetical protein
MSRIPEDDAIPMGRALKPVDSYPKGALATAVASFAAPHGPVVRLFVNDEEVATLSAKEVVAVWTMLEKRA